MNIGIPKEILAEEHRISLTSQGVYSLVKEGHNVFIEHGAGEVSRFSDENFQKMGGQIVFSPEEIYKRSDLIVKVMPLTVEETKLLGSDQMIFSFLQLRFQSKEALENLIEKNVSAVGTELIEFGPKYRPLLVAMSEIAGNMLPQIAGRFLQSNNGGRGIAIGGFPGIPPATAVILGAGTLGFNAAKYFLALGAQVIVLDDDLIRLRYIEEHLRGNIITSVANHYSLERALKFADVFVGAIYQANKRTPIVITEELLKEMKKRALIIDASIDQGGCVETSRPTTHSDPVFVKHDILHYCVPNIPSATARTSSRAMNNIVLPIVQSIARIGVVETCRQNNALQTGTYIFNGKCVNRGLANIFDLPYEKFECK
ncbi:MAG: alanine dehydrogenase [Calditrichaeota bacterium]|nr:alanine dehydrogenase [Calditrichota bacterium]